MLNTVNYKQVFKLNTGLLIFLPLKSDVLHMILVFPILDQSNQYSEVSGLKGPLYRCSNRAKLVETNFAQEAVANNWIDPVPAQPTTAFIFHFAWKPKVSDQIIVHDVKYSQHTSDYWKNSQVYGSTI